MSTERLREFLVIVAIVLFSLLMAISLFWPHTTMVVVTCDGYPDFEAALIDDGHRAKTRDKSWFRVRTGDNFVTFRHDECTLRTSR